MKLAEEPFTAESPALAPGFAPVAVEHVGQENVVLAVPVDSTSGLVAYVVTLPVELLNVLTMLPVNCVMASEWSVAVMPVPVEAEKSMPPPAELLASEPTPVTAPVSPLKDVTGVEFAVAEVTMPEDATANVPHGYVPDATPDAE
jgi:hypothetical protein